MPLDDRLSFNQMKAIIHINDNAAESKRAGRFTDPPLMMFSPIYNLSSKYIELLAVCELFYACVIANSCSKVAKKESWVDFSLSQHF